jgi:head-tail adaptor
MIENITRYYTSGITVKRYTSTQNDYGEAVFTYSSSANTEILGKIRPLKGDERYASDKITLFATHRLYCDPITITEKDIVVSGTSTYSVVFVNNVMNFNRLMQVDLEEIR